MDDPGGCLRIRLTWEQTQWRVEMQSSRPVGASRVFIGKPLAEVARQLPRLYSLCATAQSLAFASAAEQALGLRVDPMTQAVRQQGLRAEWIKEHLWRLRLDWPPLLGLPQDELGLAEVLRAEQALRAALATADNPWLPGARLSHQAVAAGQAALSAVIEQAQTISLGQPAAAWLEQVRRPTDWDTWVGHAAAPVAGLVRALRAHIPPTFGRITPACWLHPPDLADIAAHLAGAEADTFIATPRLQGQTGETTPLARLSEQPLIAALLQRQGANVETRLAALVVELALALTDRIAAPLRTMSPAPGSGLAAVNAARGLLIHRVTLQDGQVRNHQILAPTEWNCHPCGVLSQALRHLPAPEHDPIRRERLARVMVTAIDPCVPYRLDWDGGDRCEP